MHKDSGALVKIIFIIFMIFESGKSRFRRMLVTFAPSDVISTFRSRYQDNRLRIPQIRIFCLNFRVISFKYVFTNNKILCTCYVKDHISMLNLCEEIGRLITDKGSER